MDILTSQLEAILIYSVLIFTIYGDNTKVVYQINTVLIKFSTVMEMFMKCHQSGIY
jgi:hypothetical protein